MMAHFCDWLASTPLSLVIQSIAWVIPAVQVIHILCIAVIISAATLLASRARVWLIESRLAQGLVASIWIALAGLLVTGVVMTIGEPARELLNPVFRAKMLLVLAMVILTLKTQQLLRQMGGPGAREQPRPRALGALTTVSLAVWIAIVVAGRWIAYTTDS